MPPYLLGGKGFLSWIEKKGKVCYLYNISGDFVGSNKERYIMLARRNNHVNIYIYIYLYFFLKNK